MALSLPMTIMAKKISPLSLALVVDHRDDNIILLLHNSKKRQIFIVCFSTFSHSISNTNVWINQNRYTCLF